MVQQTKFSPAFTLLLAFSSWIVGQSIALEASKGILLLLGYDSSILQAALTHQTQNEDNIRLVYNIVLPMNQLLSFGLVGLLFGRFSGFSIQKMTTPMDTKKLIFISIGIICASLFLLPTLQLVVWDAQSFSLPDGYKSIENQLKELEEQAKETQKIILNQNIMLSIGIMAILPAICEELFFRFFLLNYLRKFMPNWASIVFNGFIFSLIHFQVYGFLARWILGSFFSWATIHAKNIIPAIMAHAVNNGLMVVLAYLVAHKKIDSALAEENYQLPVFITSTSLVLFILTIYFTQNIKTDEQSTNTAE